MREDVLGNCVGGRDDFDPGHQVGLHDDIGAHLAGADQSDAHRPAFALPARQAFGDGAAG